MTENGVKLLADRWATFVKVSALSGAILSAITLPLVGTIYAQTQKRIEELQQAQQEELSWRMAHEAKQAEELGGGRLKSMDKRLERIEEKLDQILQEGR